VNFVKKLNVPSALKSNITKNAYPGSRDFDIERRLEYRPSCFLHFP